MALIIGSQEADAGMSQLIFQAMDSLLSPPLQQAVDRADAVSKAAAQQALDEARKGWKKLAFAIAKGVVDHIISNMEISGITVQGDVTTVVSNNTGIARGVVLTQSNGGPGRIA
jgi:hypothetical protein